MCKRFTMLTWDETMSVVRSLEAHAPLNPVPDWPARRIDAFPDAEVSVIVGGGCAQSCRACPFPCGSGPRHSDQGPHAANGNLQPPLCGTLNVRPLRWGLGPNDRGRCRKEMGRRGSSGRIRRRQ